MSNLLTQDELARAIKYELDTRHTILAGSNPNDVYVPRIMKLIAKHDKQVAIEARMKIWGITFGFLHENNKALCREWEEEINNSEEKL